MSKKNNYKKGFTLVELMLSLLIFGLIYNVVSTFTKDVFSLNISLSGMMNTQLDARHLLKVMVTELRKSSPSSLGSYPLVLASPTAVTFYSDVDSNGIKDRVRYYLDGNTIKKGVVVPTGNPLVYNDSNEKVSSLISGVVSSSTLPLFQYYSSTYSGTGNALSQPVTVSVVRLIKITVIIDKDPGHSPIPLTVTSSVSLRNLKDNL